MTNKKNIALAPRLAAASHLVRQLEVELHRTGSKVSRESGPTPQRQASPSLRDQILCAKSEAELDLLVASGAGLKYMFASPKTQRKWAKAAVIARSRLTATSKEVADKEPKKTATLVETKVSKRRKIKARR